MKLHTRNRWKITTADAATYTASPEHDLILVPTITTSLVLPAPASWVNKVIKVKKTALSGGTHRVTITPASGTIDGRPSRAMAQQNHVLSFISDGSNIHILDEFRPLAMTSSGSSGDSPGAATTGSFADVLNLSVGANIAGGRVMVGLLPYESSSNPAYWEVKSGASAVTQIAAELAFMRDTTTAIIHRSRHGAEDGYNGVTAAGFSSHIPVGGIFTIDDVTAGSYSWRALHRTLAVFTESRFIQAKIFVRELGYD